MRMKISERLGNLSAPYVLRVFTSWIGRLGGLEVFFFTRRWMDI